MPATFKLDEQKLHDGLNSPSGPVGRALKAKGDTANLRARDNLSGHTFHGQHINRITSRLVNSLRMQFGIIQSKLRFRISVSVVYGAVLHKGRGARTIKAKNAEYLHFKINGSWVKVKEVHQPPMVARPFIADAILDTFNK